jgi:hypothetical protein
MAVPADWRRTAYDGYRSRPGGPKNIAPIAQRDKVRASGWPQHNVKSQRSFINHLRKVAYVLPPITYGRKR